MADLKIINYLANSSPSEARLISMGNESDGEMEKTTVAELRAAMGLSSGTYTPTITDVSNAVSSPASLASFMRIGNEVSVRMQVLVDHISTGTFTEIGISLPIASSFSSSHQLSGAMSGGTVDYTGSNLPTVLADTSNDRVKLFFTSDPGGAPATLNVVFQYIVL